MSTGVLVMAYGTPRDSADVAAFYTDIRRGSPPPPELLAVLEQRYAAIGGTFPLRAATEAQAAGLQAALDAAAPGAFTVALGQKHAEPRIEDGVATLAGRGVDRVVGLVLAPQFSAASVGQYAARAAAAGLAAGLAVDTVPSWHLLPAYLDFLADAVRAALPTVPDGSEVVFTAHSLPQRALGPGDPYAAQLQATAVAVAGRAGVSRWSLAWQSAGRTADSWLGPSLLDVLRDRAADGARGLVVCPCGFVAEHLEVLYDLDVEAAGVASGLGLPYARTRTVGADPAVLAGLADLVRAVA